MLVADIGNTDSVFGIFDGKVLQHTLRLRSNAPEGEVFYSYHLRNFFLEKNIEAKLIKQSIFSSVVPQMNEVIEHVLSSLTDNSISVKPGMHSLVKVAIEKQNELGADIYCNAVAAFREFKQACIVVDFGTALTVTGIDSHGTIKGVAIAPGIGTALRSLFTNTAQLPEVPLEFPSSAMGRNTVTAIQSGILYGYEGMVKNLLAKFKEELNTDSKVAATGGLSSVLHTIHNELNLVDTNLTLNGLRIIGEEVFRKS
jgi:type III pantothenate kinase